MLAFRIQQPADVAAAIREARKAARMTQLELARSLAKKNLEHRPGPRKFTHPQTGGYHTMVCNYERGANFPSVATLLAIAEILRVSFVIEAGSLAIGDQAEPGESMVDHV